VSGGGSPVLRVDGDGLRALFEAGAAAVAAAAPAINAINVYPVPDGDTGSNMAATLREAATAAREVPGGSSAAAVAEAAARGALYGARGNSGVILSQALRGFARGVAGAAELDAARLAAGLLAAAEAAYAAVSRPQEGTMLTVLREAAQAAQAAAVRMPARAQGSRASRCWKLPLLPRGRPRSGPSTSWSRCGKPGCPTPGEKACASCSGGCSRG